MAYRIKEDGKLYDFDCHSQGFRKWGYRGACSEELFGELYAGSTLDDALAYSELGNEYDDEGNHLISREQWEDLSTWFAQDPALWYDSGENDTRYQYTTVIHTEDHSKEGEPFHIESYTKYEYDSDKWDELDSEGKEYRGKPDPKDEDDWIYEKMEYWYEAYEIEEE